MKKTLKKSLIFSICFLMILSTFITSIQPVKAVGVNLVAYGPPNGMSEVPIFAPMDFIFSTALSGDITSNLNTYFSISPAVSGGSWQYYNESWGDNTMYRVAYSTPEGLALNTTYTASVNIPGLTINLMSEGDFIMPALNETDGVYSFTATTTNDPDMMGGALAPMAFAGYPGEGMRDVSPSLENITVNFDNFFQMDATTFTADNIYVKDVLANTVISGTVSPNSGTSNLATIAVDLEANKQYRVYVTRNIKEINGQALMGMPQDDGSMGPYVYDFYTASTATNVTSAFMGTNLNMYMDGSGNIVNVPLGTVIFLGFNNPLDPGTVTIANVTLYNNTLSAGVERTVTYNSNENKIIVSPTSALQNGDNYTLTITSNVKSITGQAVETKTIAFTTVADADTVKPSLIHADADNYGLFMDFSEPLNQTKATNKSYYSLKTRVDSGTEWASASTISLTGANLRYSPENNSVMIDGLSLTPGQEFQITASSSITDISNNPLNDTAGANIKTGIIMDASLFGGGSGMFSGAGDINMDDMGMMPINVMPMSNMAGFSTKYFINIPISAQIPANGTIEIKLPLGFNASGATRDLQSPMNSDFNMAGNGNVVTFANTDPSGTEVAGSADDGIGVIGDRTIVIKLSAATETNDFLAIDLDNIVNSSVPKGYETDGYTAEIRTKDANGVLLEVLNSMHFFISEGGTSSLNVTVNGVTSGDNGTMNIFVDSPITGPMKKTATFNDSTSATVNFTNIPDGQYFFYTEPVVTLGSTDYSGKAMPEPLTVSGATNKTITLIKESAGGAKATITVSITGDLGTDDIDIFAGSPTGFKVKTLTDAGLNPSAQLYLPDGDWMVGMGPAMPKDPSAGPPPMPDWMPPMPTQVKISSNGTVIKEASGTANDGTIAINLSDQSLKTVTGTVVDGSGNGIANAEVYAYQPNGGFGGSNTKTASDGSFTLKIPVLGVYTIGAFKPGLPNGNEQALNVEGNMTGITIKMNKPAYTISGKVLNSSGNGVAYAPVWAYKANGPGSANATTDASGNYIIYVNDGTWILETDAPGVGWMEYGSNLTINGSSLSGINIRPSSATTYYDISGTITIDGAVQTYMPIRAVAYDANGNHLGRSYDGMTDSSGNYKISAPTGIYRVDIWTPAYGEIERTDADDYTNHPANVNLTAGNKAGVNITIANTALKTITVSVTNGTADYEGFVRIEGVDMSDPDNPKPTNYTRSLYLKDLSQTATIKLEDNKHYLFFIDIPGLGNYIPIEGTDATDGAGGMHPDYHDIFVNGVDRNVIFSIPDTSDNSNFVSINGTVSAGGSNLDNAWVWAGNPETGFNKGTNTDSSGAYSITLPVLQSGYYMIGADKPGYISQEPTQLNLSDSDGDGVADNNKNFTLNAHSSSISGYIYFDANSNNTKDSGEEILNGWVYAEEVNTGLMSHSPVDGSGAYSLGVSNGDWKVFGAADAYLDTQYKENGTRKIISVSGNVSGKNIALETDSNWNNRTKNKPMTPANGGIIDDTAAGGTGVKITVPANALGSSSSSGRMNVAETSSVTKTNSANPFGGKGKNITATDNSGQPITNLNDYIDIEMVYWKSDIDAQINAGQLADFNKLKAMQVSYFDSSVNDWVSLPTTRTAYYKTRSNDIEWKTYSGTASTTGFAKFINDALVNETFTAFEDYKLVFKSSTNHLTIFGVTTPSDGTAPAAPTGLAQISGNGSSISLNWNDNNESDLLEYEIYRSSSSGVGKTDTQVNNSQITSSAFTDSSVSAWTSYYYTVTAVDDSGNESLIASELRACSNNTVSNGTVSADCSITCNSGYNVSGNSCVAETPASSGGSGTIPVNYCSSVEYDEWQDACVNNKQYRNIKLKTPNGCILTTSQQSATYRECENPDTTEQNQSSSDEENQEQNQAQEQSQTETVNAFVEQIKNIINEAKEVIKAEVESFVNTFSKKRNMNSESQNRNRYITPLISNLEIEEKTQNAMLNFVTYGTPSTFRLGEGERTGVINSFKSAFSKLPETETDWEDIIKIANGRWPKQINKETEANAEDAFRKIYLRDPDRNNPNDDAAITIIAYGLRPGNRNLDSEKTAIKIFKAIYGYNPASATAWDIVRAIAYSGATR